MLCQGSGQGGTASVRGCWWLCHCTLFRKTDKIMKVNMCRLIESRLQHGQAYEQTVAATAPDRLNPHGSCKLQSQSSCSSSSCTTNAASS
jgi:hypothetical protein